MKLLIALFLTLSLPQWAYGSLPDHVLVERLDHFALGSCNNQDKEQWMWSVIKKHDPQFWLWLGDNIYGDSAEKSVMQRKYQQLLSDPGYKMLRESIPVIGTWDDHDYGQNDGDKNFEAKEQNRLLFLDFIGEALDSNRWNRNGIYTSYTLGPAGQQVKVILLDVRYSRDEPGEKSDILGEEQWQWLEKELSESQAQIHFIASGTSVLPSKDKAKETWQKYPASFQRMHLLLRRYETPGVAFLVGDRHMSAILQRDHKGTSYLELMASGLTHHKKGFGKWVAEKYYGKKNSLFHKNFAEIFIEWSNPLKMSFKAYSKKKSKYKLSKDFELSAEGDWMLVQSSR